MRAAMSEGARERGSEGRGLDEGSLFAGAGVL